MVKDSASSEMRRPSFDKIVASNTGVFKVGVRLSAPLAFASLDFEENFALVDRDGDVQVGNKDGTQRVHQTKKSISSVACLGPNAALIGHESGIITKVARGEEARDVFSDIRQAAITSITCDGTGSFYVAGSDSGRVYMCRTAKGDEVWTRVQDGPGVLSVAANRQGNMFAVSRKHKETEVFNTSAPRTHFVRFSTAQPVVDMAFSGDGHLLALLLEDQTIALHMVLNGHRMMYIKDDVNTLNTIGFNVDNELVGYFSIDGELHGVDLQRELAMA
jgi:WD40 repeat protein